MIKNIKYILGIFAYLFFFSLFLTFFIENDHVFSLIIPTREFARKNNVYIAQSNEDNENEFIISEEDIIVEESKQLDEDPPYYSTSSQDKGKNDFQDSNDNSADENVQGKASDKEIRNNSISQTQTQKATNPLNYKKPEIEFKNIGSIYEGNFYTIQIASYSNFNNAIYLKDRLIQAGYSSFIIIKKIDAQYFYRVNIGLFSSKIDAENYLKYYFSYKIDSKPFIIFYSKIQ